MENSIEESKPEQPIEKATNPQQGRSKHLVHLRFLKPSFWSIFSIVIVFTSLLAVYYMFAITDNFLFVILFEVIVSVVSLFLLLLFIKFIKKIYNIFGLMLTLAVAGIIILGLIIFGLNFYYGLPPSPILDSPPLGSLVIIIGLALYVLYLCIKTDKKKIPFWKELIIIVIATIIIFILILISLAILILVACAASSHCHL